jgi:hypothetical protein
VRRSAARLGVRWRNPECGCEGSERLGFCEAIRNSDGGVCSLSGVGPDDIERHTNTDCDAGSSSVVCAEDMGAAERCDASQ